MADVPMKMPDLSTVSSTVKVVRWLVAPGEAVRRGDHLLEVETDKSTMIVESTLTGTLKATIAEPGEEVPTGVAIATFEVEGADAPDEVVPDPAHQPAAPPTASAPPSPPPRTPGAGGGSFFAKNRRAAGGSGADSTEGKDEG